MFKNIGFCVIIILASITTIIVFKQDNRVNVQLAQKSVEKTNILEQSHNVVMVETDRGGGSGFLITTDGVVITAKHVIQDCNKATVLLTGARKFSVHKVIVSDYYDVAFLKIDALESSTCCTLWDSKNIKRLDEIYSIGTPANDCLFNFVVQGYVAHCNINMESWIKYPGINVNNYLCLIMPAIGGQSGSPVFNKDGKVIGLVSMGYGDNLCFALPSDVFVGDITIVLKLFGSYDTELISLNNYTRLYYE
jgi:S1-C subfamily serine protease